VDWAIQNALARNLNIIVNVHHYGELLADPVQQRPRFAAMWQQIAERYKEYPAQLLFELYNEPNSMSAKYWNEIAAETLAVIRASNPTRNILVGGVDNNSVNGLLELRLPEADSHLIGTFHYYLPFEFTHQGADWINGSEPWLGKTWGAGSDKANVAYDMSRAAEWGKKYARPVYLGEFGAYREADMDSRAAWTAVVARQAEKQNINWAYWDFVADFAVYDRTTGQWVEPIRRALLP
jgi:endoglucanase